MERETDNRVLFEDPMCFCGIQQTFRATREEALVDCSTLIAACTFQKSPAAGSTATLNRR